MSVSNGQLANQTTFNNAFVSRTVDTSTAGKLDLINADVTNSGASVTNTQRELNSVSSWIGKALNIAKNALPSWVNTNVGTGTDDLLARAEALTVKFQNISAGEIILVPLRGYEKQGVDLTGVTGTSTDVSTEMTGKIPSTLVTVAGVVVNAPYNKVYVAATSTLNPIEDGSGNRVYGRITESVGVWTLSYYVLISGVETAYSFSSTNISWWYQELFNPLSAASPTYSEAFVMPSDNTTNDVVDASTSQRGLVSTADQTFSGIKRFLNQLAIRDTSAAFDVVMAFVSSVALTVQRTLTIDIKNANRTLTISGNADVSGTNTGDVSLTAIGSTPATEGASLSGQALTLQPADDTHGGVLSIVAQLIAGIKTFVNSVAFKRHDVASTASILAMDSSTSFAKLTGSTATTLHGIDSTSVADGQIIKIFNGSSASLIIKNQSGSASASDRIITSSGVDQTVAPNNSAEFIYDTAQSRWVPSGGSGGGATISQKNEILSGTVNGSNTAFTVSQTPLDTLAVIVYLDGIKLEYTTHYTISGTTVTFVTAPATAQVPSAYYLY